MIPIIPEGMSTLFLQEWNDRFIVHSIPIGFECHFSFLDHSKEISGAFVMVLARFSQIPINDSTYIPYLHNPLILVEAANCAWCGM